MNFLNTNYFTGVANLRASTKVNETKTFVDAQSSELVDHNPSVESKKPSQRALVLVVIFAALFFIGFCIFLAALLAKYQKRGRKTLFEEPGVRFKMLVDEA